MKVQPTARLSGARSQEGLREQSVDFHFPLAFLLFLIAFKGMLSSCVCPGRGVS